MHLPIDDVLPALLSALQHNPAVVLRAPTGAGKTTRVPLALLRGAWGEGGLIVMTEPRRLAARAAARWMAAALGEEVGQTIGYQVRLDRKAGPKTRILVVTEGVLLRMFQQDPFLEGVQALIFDEFHERSLTADVALAMARKVQQEVRDDLRILVMSATLDPGPVAAFLAPCATVESLGRLHPVTIEHARVNAAAPVEASARDAALELLRTTSGDLLVFLPGIGEIRRTLELLRAVPGLDVDLLPLHGSLTAAEQDAALRAGSRRRVVLATNVAETSVTVEGVTAVIDSGLARTLLHNPAAGLDRLELGMISRDAADQRAGRAGRQQPGRCVRLWSEHRHLTLPERTAPEIRRVDLAGVALQLLAWGEHDLAAFPWFEPPAPEALQRARQLLRLLGALDDRGLTPLGRAAADLPLHPRLAVLVQAGHRLGHLRLAARAAALLSDRDPFRDPQPNHRAGCDLLGSLDALDAWEQRRPRRPDADPGRVAFTLESARHLEDAAARLLGPTPPPTCTRHEALARALLAGWPDRVAIAREPQSPRALMVGGRGVQLHPTSQARGAALWLALDLDDAQRPDALVRRATTLQLDWLDPQHLSEARELDFDPQAQRVGARLRRRYLDLVLNERPAPMDDPHAAAQLLAAHAAHDLHTALNLADPAHLNVLARLRFLAFHNPELGLPSFDDDHLRSLLPTLCHGARSFEDLRRLDLPQALLNTLPWPQRQALDRAAPEHLPVPSGSHIRLDYDPDPTRPPILAVRIQELFGLRETPTVAEGRVPVVLHLLAPNHRPQQVTQDLRSFWANTWPEVRRELRQRYPRHAWPDDPLTATPERRPQRKKKD